MKKNRLVRCISILSVVALALFNATPTKAQTDVLDLYSGIVPPSCPTSGDIQIPANVILNGQDITVIITPVYGRRSLIITSGIDHQYRFSGANTTTCPSSAAGAGSFQVHFTGDGSAIGLKKVSFQIINTLGLNVTITPYQGGSPGTPVTGGSNTYAFTNVSTPFDSFVIECPNNPGYDNTSNFFILDNLLINNPPTDISLSNNSIDENLPVGTAIGTLLGTDPDAGDPYTYSLVTGTGDTDNSLFTITGNTLKSNAAFNYEGGATSYSIRVEANDGYDGKYSKQLIININDVIELVSFTINPVSNADVNENSPYTSLMPGITGSPIGTVNYTLEGSDAGSFTINSSTGVVSMVARNFEAPADANSDNVYDVTIRATDSDGNYATRSWTVSVKNMNEPASFTIDPIGNAPVNENTSYTSVLPHITGTPNGAVIYSLGGTDAGKFIINSTTGVVSMLARNFEAPEDANVDNNYEVTITAADGDSNSDSEDWIVTVTNLIESASFTINPIASIDVNENSSYTSVTPVISGENPIGSVTYTLEGTDAGDFTINSGTGVVSMVARNFEAPEDVGIDNVYELTIKATDHDINSATKGWTVTVKDVIEPASIAIDPIADVSINENSAYTSVMPHISGDTPIGIVIYSLGGADAGKFSINSSTGVVSMVARDFENPVDANALNNYEVSITATDADGNHDSEDWIITVLNVLSEGPPEVVCVLDLSWSMNRDFFENPVSDPNTAKLASAKSALIAFTDLLYSNNQGLSIYGLARFPSSPQLGCDAGSIHLMQTLDITYRDNLAASIPTLIADGMSTPLLAGIDFAMTLFNSDNKKIIVLLTDGIQNCPGSDMTTAITDPYIASLVGGGIKLYTIGFGSSTLVSNSFLNTMASGTGGVHYDIQAVSDKSPSYNPSAPTAWTPATALYASYANIIINGLGLTCTNDPMDIITAGSVKTFEIPVTVFDNRVCFFVSWVTTQQNCLGVKLYTPAGNELSLAQAGILTINRNNHSIITLTDGLLNQPGMRGLWKLEITGSGIVGESEHYQYSVITSSQKLDLKTWFEKEKYFTGDKIKIFAELLLDGIPLTDLKKSSILGTTPVMSPGNWLVSKKVDNKMLEKEKQKVLEEYLKWISVQPQVTMLTSEAREKYINSQKQLFLKNINPVELRYHALLGEFKLTLPGRVTIKGLNFTDDGLNGDQTAHDGIYTAVYTPKLEGSYNFNFSFSDSIQGEKILRESNLQTYVGIRYNLKPKFKSIRFIEKSLEGERLYDLTFSLKDKYGNIPMPDELNNISLSVDKGILIGKITDNLDGTFTQRITLPMNLKPKNVIMKLTSGEMSESVRISKGNLWTILPVPAVAILAVLFFLMRKKKS